MWSVKMNSGKKNLFFLLISGSRPVPETLDCAHALVPALFLHKSCSCAVMWGWWMDSAMCRLGVLKERSRPPLLAELYEA